MIKTRINNEYKDIIKIFGGGTLQKEIIKVWSREAQEYVYESSVEYTGSLPITIRANGDVLLDYRIYGADGGVGEPTENLFDINSLYSTVVVQGQIFTKPTSAYFFDVFSGSNGGSAPINLQKSIPVTSGTYTLSFEESETKIAVVFSDGETQTVIANSSSVTPRTFDVPSDGYISIRCENPNVCSVKKLQIIKSSTAPSEYIPYGYKLPMTVMDNLAPPLSQWVDGYISINGEITPSSVPAQKEKTSDFIEVKPNTQYTFGIEGNAFPQGANGSWLGIGLYSDDRTFISRPSSYLNPSPYTFLTPSKAKYVRLSYRTYGELLEPRLSENSFSIPVYIGENQLGEDEYVSFSDQKIYKDVSGTLTPTDPPVPLPEIPTIDGETVIDYDGDQKPSQMYIKYRR